MIKKDLIIVVLATFCLTCSMFIVLPRSSQNIIPTPSSSSQSTSSSDPNPYDPWCDVNHDGKISILDVVDVTSRYGTAGDPALSINITNWPTSHDVCVWWDQYVGPSSQIVTNEYDAGGFGHLHVLMSAALTLAPGHNITVEFWAPIYNQTRTTDTPLPFYTLVLTSSNWYAAVSLDVPSQGFYFAAKTGASTTCDIYLSYYLTWS
jgi:hypothetical protein